MHLPTLRSAGDLFWKTYVPGACHSCNVQRMRPKSRRSIFFAVDFGAFSAGDHRGSVCWQPGREGSRLGRRISRDVILPFEIRVACKEMSPPSFSPPVSEDAAMALLFAYRTSLARR